MNATSLEGERHEPAGRQRVDAVPAALVAFVVAAWVGAAVRVWQLWARDPLSWGDTTDFLVVARSGWTSPELWAGARAPAVPVVLKLLGEDQQAFVYAQAALAVTCWALLCASVAVVVAGRWPRAVAVGAVLAMSVTTPVTMWERSVLSESAGVSTLALVVAAGLQVARGVTWPRVAMLAGALAPWLAVRDTHAVVALVGGGVAVVVAVAMVVDRRRRARSSQADEDALADGAGAADGAEVSDGARATDGPDPAGAADVGAADGPTAAGARRTGGAPVRLLASLGAAAIVLGLLVLAGASHGERQGFPTRNVYEVRVLPYPERVRWFADHGMPQADAFLGPDARVPAREPGIPPVVYVADDDPELQPWLEWVESDGRVALARYALTHPGYIVAEPLRTPERAFNNALGDRTFYRALDQREVPFVDGLLARRTVEVLLVGGAVGGWAIGRGRWTPALVTGAVTVLLAVPHGIVAWHSDGMETARHLVVPALQLHLGVLVMLVGLLPEAGAPSRVRGGRAG